MTSAAVPPEHHYVRIVARITDLAEQGCTAPTITRVLRNEGYTMAPGRSDSISLTTVRRLLRENAPPARRRPVPAPEERLRADEWWLRDLAAELSMPQITLYAWARRGWVTVARQESRPPYRLILRADHGEVVRLRARRPSADGRAAAPGLPEIAL